MVKRSSKFCFVARRDKVLGMELVRACIYNKFGFSRPDLNGNKLAKGMCLARKARNREVFI